MTETVRGPEWTNPLRLLITSPTNARWRNGAVVLARAPGVPLEPGDLVSVPAGHAARFLAEFPQPKTWQYLDEKTFWELMEIRERVMDVRRREVDGRAEREALEANREAQRIAAREALEDLVREAAAKE